MHIKFTEENIRMGRPDFTNTLTQTVRLLSEQRTLKGLCHHHRDGYPLPSGKVLEEIVELVRAIIFPGYFGHSSVNTRTIEYYIGVNVERLHKLLADQVTAGLCFATGNGEDGCGDRDGEDDGTQKLSAAARKAQQTATNVVARLPELRRMLATDVEAAYHGDPAARNYGEIISCYPVIKALTNYRFAHELLAEGVPLIPRMLTEMAHSETGIDIHPGATIGHHFTIDHGTGVVIGATCVIGDNVMLYQGVTLGAKNFTLDESGHPIDLPRHPIIEDNVTIYSNSSVLGRITIGHDTVIGGNVWVTHDVPPHSRLLQHRAATEMK